MQTGELREISILEIAGGAVIERLERELGKVIRNISDPNTDPKKVRKIKLELTFRPNEARDAAPVEIACDSKLVPVRPVETTLVIGGDEETPLAMEWNRQAPGQIGFDGSESEHKLIKLA